MFHYLYYSIMLNEDKEKFKIVFSGILVIKNFVVPSSLSNFSVKLICGGIILFVRLDKYVPMSS